MPYSDPGSGRTALISGVGVAGPCLAYWLLQAGVRPTLIEAAPKLRTGGYMIDFWGAGFEVAERMGLAPRLREIGYRVEELQVLDAQWRPMIRPKLGAIAGVLGDRYVSLQRGDLSAALCEMVQGHVETRFNDEVMGLRESGHGIEASFRRGAARTFDLVIGADGLHSRVRRLAFRNGSFEKRVGYYVAAFTARDYPFKGPNAYMSRTTPGRQVATFQLRDGRTSVFMFVAAGLAAGRPLETGDAQRAFLVETFADIGRRGPEVMAALEAADDLYFDAVSQIHMPAWSKGHVALVGDAAWAPSLLAGEGAALAMAGAYVLAGELAHAGPDLGAGLAAYERRLRGYVERKQRAALGMAGWFAPKTAFGLFVRNQLTRLAGVPAFAGLLVGPMVSSDLDLPRYDWSF